LFRVSAGSLIASLTVIVCGAAGLNPPILLAAGMVGFTGLTLVAFLIVAFLVGWRQGNIDGR
jgi:hypothetical protein